MGLDISISVDNTEEIFSEDYYAQDNDFFHKHNLSRTFCNFISRKNVINEEPELDQIGRITDVDVSALYDMEVYCDANCIEENLEYIDDEEEKQRFLQRVQQDNARVEGNIETVYMTISRLIDELSSIENLPSLLKKTDYDTLGNDIYFADFTIDKGDGYLHNNFGQDLRNFKKFIEYAKTKGTKTVYFTYG